MLPAIGLRFRWGNNSRIHGTVSGVAPVEDVDIMSLTSSKALARRLFPQTYEKVQIHRMGRKLATEGSAWAQNALNDAILSPVIRSKLSPTSTAIDIGAAHGRFTREMAQVAIRGSILAIEPVPARNTQLQGIFRSSSNVSVLPYAVGKESNLSDLWVCDSNTRLSGLTATSAARRTGTVRAITVPVRTVDSIAMNHEQIDLIKIDVESGEYDVLLGSANTLSQHNPIVAFECTMHADQVAASPANVFEILARYGYEVFEPIGYLRGTKPLSKDYFVESIAGDHEFFFFPSTRAARTTI